MKKYKLTKDTITINGDRTLYRIQALRDFSDVKAGDFEDKVSLDVIIHWSKVNYPRTKDSWASDFTEECPFKRLGLLSSPSVYSG